MISNIINAAYLGFLEKNRDTFNADLIQLIQVSQNKFLKNLFSQDLTMVFVNMFT